MYVEKQIEEILGRVYNCFNYLEKAIDEYIVFFNTVRPHGSLGNRTPEEFDEDGLIKAKENRQN